MACQEECPTKLMILDEKVPDIPRDPQGEASLSDEARCRVRDSVVPCVRGWSHDLVRHISGSGRWLKGPRTCTHLEKKMKKKRKREKKKKGKKKGTGSCNRRLVHFWLGVVVLFPCHTLLI